jgi:hypothetical protein
MRAPRSCVCAGKEHDQSITGRAVEREQSRKGDQAIMGVIVFLHAD